MPAPATADRPDSGPEPDDSARRPDARMPDYKGEPLDAERGPGLGCFWIQIALLVVLLVATPLSVVLVAPPWFSAALLILTLVLLLFVGQTTIFLLRLVAADRRTRRRPLRTGASKTVGELEAEAAEAAEGAEAAEAAEAAGAAEAAHGADTPAAGQSKPDHE